MLSMQKLKTKQPTQEPQFIIGLFVNHIFVISKNQLVLGNPLTKKCTF